MSNQVFINATERYPTQVSSSQTIVTTFFNNSFPADVSNPVTIELVRIGNVVFVRMSTMTITITVGQDAASVDSSVPMPDEFWMGVTSFEPVFVTIGGVIQTTMGTMSVSSGDGVIRFLSGRAAALIADGQFQVETVNISYIQ